jgi:hypothetical protein
LSPLSAVRSRRIRSSDSPSSPHGTKCSSPRSVPSWCAVTTTQSGSAGPPIRDSAIEKPRSTPPPRQAAATDTSWASSAAGTSPVRRTSAVNPARSIRDTACRTPRIDRPARLNVVTSSTASSPSSYASRPCRAQTVAPREPQAITAGTQACRRASSSPSAIAPGQASGSPIGSPLTSSTPCTTRYVSAALPLPDQTTLLSRRSAK